MGKWHSDYSLRWHGAAGGLKALKLFEEGHRLALRSRKRRVPWNTVIKLWTESAKSGNARALFYLGTVYDVGLGRQRNLSRAFEYYWAAGRLNHVLGRYNQALMLRDGVGHEANIYLAAYWLRDCAERGLADAQRDFGFALFYGNGVRRNTRRAVSFYRRAAAQGDEKAQFNLGLCYLKGTGVKKSKRWGNFYLRRAARSGDKRAKQVLKKILGEKILGVAS